MIIKLTDQEMDGGKLEMLARILATQQASTDTLIDILSKAFVLNAEEYVDQFNDLQGVYLTNILNCFYANKGEVDFDGLLGNK